MQVADRAAGVAPELQVDQAVGVGKGDGLTLHVGQFARHHDVADDVLVIERCARRCGCGVSRLGAVTG